MSKENEPKEEPKAKELIHQDGWTSQMVGTHFWQHHDMVDTDYTSNPDPRVDFSEIDTF